MRDANTLEYLHVRPSLPVNVSRHYYLMRLQAAHKNLVSGDETMSVTSTGIAVCKGIFCCLWKLLGEA